jgi:hypothetical protein
LLRNETGKLEAGMKPIEAKQTKNIPFFVQVLFKWKIWGEKEAKKYVNFFASRAKKRIRIDLVSLRLTSKQKIFWSKTNSLYTKAYDMYTMYSTVLASNKI